MMCHVYINSQTNGPSNGSMERAAHDQEIMRASPPLGPNGAVSGDAIRESHVAPSGMSKLDPIAPTTTTTTTLNVLTIQSM